MDFGSLKVTYLADERPVVRAAGIVDRINQQTARNATANDRLIERSAKQLADARGREARRASNDFIRELERMRRAERASSGGGSDTGGTLSTMLGGRLAFAGAGPATAIGAMTAAFGAATKAGVEYKGALDRVNRSFANLMGSQAAAAAHLKELEEFTSRTPFEFLEIARASQRFQAMGIEAKKVVPLLADIANAVATIGGGQDEIDRVALAIAQVNAKGRVMSQEMNQLSEVGISGWKALQAETGKTREELMKMVEAGDVSAETFNRAFHQMYGDGKALQEQMETLGGSQARLTDEGQKLLAYAYTPLHGALRDIVVEANKLRTTGWDTERMFTALASASRNFIDNFLPARLMGVNETLDKMLIVLGYGSKPPANWGTGEAPPSLNIPDPYKEKIPNADLDKLRQQDFMRAKEAFTVESLRKVAEAQHKAEQETQRQADIIKRIGQEYDEAKVRVDLFGKSNLELEKALYKVSDAYKSLSEANKGEADKIIDRLFAQKGIEERLQTEADFRKTLTQTVESHRAALYGEQTEVKKLEEVVGEFVKKMQAGSSELYMFDDAMAANLRTAKEYATALDWINTHLKLIEQNRAAGQGFNSEDLLRPTQAVGTAQPSLRPSVPLNFNVSYLQTFREELEAARDSIPDVEETWRSSVRTMVEDGGQMFANMFMRIGEGWRSAVEGLVLDFAQALNQMAAQAAASAVWGAILKMAGAALSGALLSAGSSAHGALDAISHPGYASGTMSATPGLHWVGESGPELVAFRGGEQVFNSEQSRRMAGTVINKTTIINYQPRVTPNSYTSRRSSRETFETLLNFAR